MSIHAQAKQLPKGHQTSFTLLYRNLPSGSGLVVALERENPSHSWEYRGETGPLTLEPVPISGSGSRRVPWNVQEVGCAPSDIAEWCPIQPGRYRVIARVYDQADFGILGNLVELEPTPKEVVTSSSAAFRITGSIDLEEPASVLRTAAYQRVADKLFPQEQLLSVGDHDDLATMLQLDAPVRQTARGLCATYKLRGAVRGELLSCLPDARLDHGGLRSPLGKANVFGAVGWAEGVMPFGRAKRLALQRARALHIEPLEERVHRWAYHSQEGYWLFDVLGVLRGGTWVGPDKIVDRVLVRVNNAGAACIVTVQAHSRPEAFDLQIGDRSCR